MNAFLSEPQIAVLRQRLRAREAELREQVREELLRSDQAHYADLAGRVHDAAEESVADLLADLDIASIDRHVAELRDIDAALLRIAEGNFGICIDCGEPIGEARLHAYPIAKRCYACQQRQEQRRGAPHTL